MEKHPLHIKIPELQKSEEVNDAVSRHERLTDETLPNDATKRIEVYMSRLEKIFLNPDERVRERNLEILRESLYDAFIIKPEQVPESYFELQQQVARERGQAIEEIPQNVRDQMIETIIKDQKHSLDSWIDYLTGEDAVYPTWFKYFVFRNIIKLSQFDKSLGKFKDRTETTTAPYPDVYREPLAQICDIYEQVAGDNKKLSDPKIQEAFSKKFPKLYAELITKSLAASMEGKEEIRGEWIKYEQGNQEHAEKLFKSLEGKGTGWCTAGKSTAETQIESGDFYVYYTYDKNNVPTQPRIAIRMNGQNEIGEVRGIQQHQSLEPLMQDVLEEKLKEFGPEADKYKKKTEDMKKLTEIEKKTKDKEKLTKPDLEFLYEINNSIEGFGYQKDPRIEEIRKQRNVKEDLPILFDCEPSQIATNANEVNKNTVAYIGEWSVDIYNKIKDFPNIKHLYESFPHKKIFMRTLETDSSIQTPKDAEEAILKGGHSFYGSAKEILQKTEFSKERKEYELVSFSVGQLGFPQGATTKEIYEKANELGLELCPAEVGPQLRLQYKDQPNEESLWIAMNAIADSDGYSRLWYVSRNGGGESWLHADWDYPGGRWFSGRRFVFSRRTN
ncbi:hypothetical protein IT397_00745, partial [Candidatus Nomurabacteria bacterium]|nr:hypothetical protein [Candidatus Nomurabacteria bacterium]